MIRDYKKEWEKAKIFKVINSEKKIKTINPPEHFPILMAHITKQAVEKYNYIID